MSRFPRFRSKRRDASTALDVDRELAYHLERRTKDLMREGVPAEEASRLARCEFGDVEAARDYCSRMSTRADRRARRRRAAADVGTDVRYALRGLRRNPGFAAVAIGIMALGIGATTAVFSVISAVVLQPLDYPEPDRLVQVWETNRRNGNLREPVSPVDLQDWRAQATTLDIAGFSYQALALSGDGRPERLIAVEVSPDFFDVLGVSPAQGRGFRTNEQGPSSRIAVVSHGLWTRRFGTDPALLGQTIVLGGLPYTVVGIAPEGFGFPSSAELWVPFTFDVEQLSRGQHFLSAVGRLTDGSALDEARAEMDAIATRLEEEYPQNNTDQGIHLVPLHEQIVGSSSLTLWVVFGAVALVLLIACGNVGNMLLVRAAGRSGEIAIRKALGAGGWRLARQLLVEGLAISTFAGIIGVAVAGWSLNALVAAIPASLPRTAEITLDLGMLGFALALATITGLAFGIGPVLESTGRGGGIDVASSGVRASGGRRIRWMRDGLLVAEVGLTLVLLVGAGLLIANFAALRGVDPGFDPGNVLTAKITLPPEKYTGPEERTAFVRRLLEEVGSLPGVEKYGTVDSLPFSGSRSSSSFEIDGDIEDPERSRNADRREVSAGYFESMGISLQRGRDIAPTDTTGAPAVAVVNAAFEQRFLSGDAIGRRIRIGGPEEVAVYGEPIWREIVGVVEDIIHDDLKAEPAPEMYLPYDQHPSTRIAVAVRSATPPEDLTGALRDAVLRVDPDQPIYNTLPMEARLSGHLALARANAWALGVFSTTALLLAVVAIYSVVSYTVAQRRRELGIRVALGARNADVVRLVLRDGMMRVALGLLLGFGGSLLATRVVRALLFNVDATDPIALGAPVALLAVAGLLACMVPAIRTLSVDIVEELRRS